MCGRTEPTSTPRYFMSGRTARRLSSRWQWVGRTGEPEHKTRDSGGPCFRKRGVCHTAGLLFVFSITSLDFECFVCVVVLVQDKVARNMAQGTLAPTLPSEAEAIIARESSRVLASHAQNAEPLRLRMDDDPGKQTVTIPVAAVQMLIHILEEMARGMQSLSFQYMPNLQPRKRRTC